MIILVLCGWERLFRFLAFFATTSSLENQLKNGEYGIRLTTANDFIFSIEYKTLDGEFHKIATAIINDKLCISSDEKYGTLAKLIAGGSTFKGLKPMAYKEKFLDADEEKLFERLQKDFNSKEEALQEFDGCIRVGIENVQDYEDELQEKK